jgi:hypothetical protein
MSRILMWTEADITGLERDGMSRIITEVDEDGFVTRELGFDGDGALVHRHPGEPSRAKYGYFDLAKIAPADTADMDAEEFERLWSA